MIGIKFTYNITFYFSVFQMVKVWSAGNNVHKYLEMSIIGMNMRSDVGGRGSTYVDIVKQKKKPDVPRNHIGEIV